MNVMACGQIRVSVKFGNRACSLSQDTLAISTAKASENHTDCGPLEMGKKERIICPENAEMGGSTSSRMPWTDHTSYQLTERDLGYQENLFYKEKARAAGKQARLAKEENKLKHK